VCGSFPINILWIDAFVGIDNLAFHDFKPVYLRVQCKSEQIMRSTAPLTYPAILFTEKKQKTILKFIDRRKTEINLLEVDFDRT